MKSDKPINTLIENFLSEQDIKPYVGKNMKFAIDRFIQWMVVNKIDVRNPKRKHVIHYKQSLIDEGKTPTTINTYLAAVRRFFTWLEERHIYEHIAAGIRAPRDSREFLKEYLPPEQVRQLLSIIPKDTLTGKRDYAIINLMLINALRRIEILRLKISDLKMEADGMVLYIQRKGKGYKDKILLLPEVFNPIQDYLLKRVNYLDDEPLFANHSPHPHHTLSETMLSRIVKTYLKKISDSKKLTCHSLRHSTAINLLKAGKSIYDVQQLLGHTSTNTTELYLRAIKAERRFNNPLSSEAVKMYLNT